MKDNKIIRVENLKKYYKGGTIKALDNISGEINTKEVNVYNYEKGCHFSGSRNHSNYSIYNYGDGCHISLEIDGKTIGLF